MDKPQVSSGFAQRELDSAEKQFEKFDKDLKDLTLDRMNKAPRIDSETSHGLSNRQIEDSKDIYLKPKRSIHDRKTFDEKYRKKYDYDKEYVIFIAENKEIQGEAITCWTKKYKGVPAEEWEIPVGKPVWAPRYVAEQLKSRGYHRFVMQDRPTNIDGMGQYYGSLAVDTYIQRLDAHPATKQKSIFMGATNF